MRDFLPEIVAIIIIVLLACIFLFGNKKASEAYDNKLWNGGHCNNCDGTWEYEQAVGHNGYTSYIYVCKNCGKRIELYEMR